MKNQKGITLVALVITIIVLLILAGVSISLVVGQNGVLTKATSSVSSNKAASAKQAVSLALASCETKYYTDWVQNQSVARSSTYTSTAIGTELSNQGYTATCSKTGSIIGSAATFTVKNGGDTVYLTVTVDTAGKITWGEISIKDGSTNTVGTGI